MTYREALLEAVEFIRGSGTEDRLPLVAAKVLERKVSKLDARAQTAARLANPEWCECGECKPAAQSFCGGCNAAFPMKMVWAFHFGTAKQSSRAWGQMLRISRGRLLREEKAG